MKKLRIKFHCTRLIRLSGILLFVLFFAFSVRGEERKQTGLEPARILLISPFNSSQVQYNQISSSLIEKMNRSGGSYLVDQFYLEKNDPTSTEDNFARFSSCLQDIQAGKYRLVITFFYTGYELIRDELDSLPSSVNVIACELPYTIADTLPKKKNVVYLFQDFSVAKNLELIRKMFPQKQKVILLTHWHLAGRETRMMALREIKKFPELKLVIIDNETIATDQMLATVNSMKNEAVVLFQGWYNRKAVNAASILQLFNAFGNPECDIPVFVMNSALLQYKTVGGYVVDGIRNGQMVADVALQLLETKNGTDINPFFPGYVILNEGELEHFRIPQKTLPENAIILGRPDFFWETHPVLTYTALYLFIFLAVLILVSLGVMLRYRKLSNQIRALFQNLPIRLMVTDEHGSILLYQNSKDAKIKKLSDFPQKTYSAILPVIQDVMKTGTPRNVEYQLYNHHQKGSFVQLPTTIFGKAAVLGIGIDVEDLHNLAINEKILNESLRAVLPNPKTISFKSILKIFCTHFQGDCCFLIQYDKKNRALKLKEEYCISGAPSDIPFFIAEHNEILLKWFEQPHEKQLLIYDYTVPQAVTLDDEVLFNALQHRNLKRSYVIPIFLNDQFWGVWGLSFRTQDIVLSLSQQQLFPAIVQMVELLLQRQEFVMELANARDQAQAANRAKSAFLAAMSHELRTPLNAVIGFSELLKDEPISSDDRKEYITGINLAAKSLLEFINNILDFSKLESEQMKIISAPTCLSSIFQDLQIFLGPYAATRGLTLNLCCPSMPDLMLDALRLKQILINLIGNAIKFTEQGSITVQAEYRNRQLQITVADTGCGISKSIQDKIFDPFVQEDRNSVKSGGTGLGLPISKKLAEKMGGTLKVDSEIGHGSVFTLTLDEIAETDISAESSQQDAKPILSFLPKVLLVDDSPINLRVFEAILERHDIIPFKAKSGREALEILQRKWINIVFTDLHMPGMSGQELAEKIHKNPALSDVKIVAVTADVLFTNENKDFDAILLKPFSLEQLMKILERLTRDIIKTQKNRAEQNI